MLGEVDSRQGFFLGRVDLADGSCGGDGHGLVEVAFLVRAIVDEHGRPRVAREDGVFPRRPCGGEQEVPEVLGGGEGD